ncbi:MAG: hypothetical protein KatS3mg050_0004 [Litorilinea sp.]|nr:MAG: hypothetical protein KatS3mg050_0004 [Litorilinea sp.]
MSDKLVGIQIGAVSFVDEGVEPVLDILQERGAINALMLASFTFTRGTGGRQIPGQPLPDHGVQEYDLDFRGGNYATIHPRYYATTVIGEDARAPDHGDWDFLAEVIPAARQRGMACYAWIEESSYSALAQKMANFIHLLEQDVYGRPTSQPCFNNPLYRNWHFSLLEDYLKSYDLDGIQWCSERWGPLNNLIQGPAEARRAVCFCPHCRQLARERGIDVERARAGYLALAAWNQDVSQGERPIDGAFVTFWRLLLQYPEILAWAKLWADSQHQFFREIYGVVKAIDPAKQVGWHIWHPNSFNPFFRAEQDFSVYRHFSDFIKPVLYNNCAGPRYHRFHHNLHKTLFADAQPEETYAFMQRILNLEEAPLAELPTTGFSPDYVYRETRRTIATAGPEVRIYPGIDVDIPTGPDETKCTRAGVRDAVLAAFRAGAHGVIISRKYSEMRLDNLSGVGDAIRELG